MRRALLLLLLSAPVRGQASRLASPEGAGLRLSAVAAGVRRLAAGSWTLGSEDGSAISPPVVFSGLQRVVVLAKPTPPGQVFVMAWQGKELMAGLLPESAFSAGSQATASEERSAFAQDALLTLRLAHGIDDGSAPAYSSFLAALRRRLLCLAPALRSGSGWGEFKKKDAAGLAVDLKDKPASLERLKTAVFAAYDPASGEKTLGQETLLVPLSLQWFRTTPALERRYQTQFVDRGLDSHMSGGSGEGVTGLQGQPATWKQFEDYAKELLDLKAFTASLKDPLVEATSEQQWLQKQSEASFAGARRLIFIHEHTWDAPAGQQWAEGISIDQSFGPIAGQPVFSVLIHEINVNSTRPVFIPSDTHMPLDRSQALWALAAGEGAGVLKEPQKLAEFLVVNPPLGAVALGYHLSVLAQASGASCP